MALLSFSARLRMAWSGAPPTSISSSDHAPTRRQPQLSLYRAPLSGPVRGCGPLRFPGHRASVPVPGGVRVCHSGAAPGSRSPRSPVQPAARGRGGAWTRRASGTRGGVPGRAESCASLLPGDGMPPAARDVGSAGARRRAWRRAGPRSSPTCARRLRARPKSASPCSWSLSTPATIQAIRSTDRSTRMRSSPRSALPTSRCSSTSITAKLSRATWRRSSGAGWAARKATSDTSRSQVRRTGSSPDAGELNYAWLLPLIDALGYAGWVGCEYRPAAGTEAGLGWARRWGIHSPPGAGDAGSER